MASLLKPGLDLFRSKTSGEYVIFNYAAAVGGNWLVSSGKLIRVSPDVMKARGLSLILQNLDEFASRQAVRSEFDGLSQEAQDAFFREHDSLSIRQPGGDVIVVTPMVPGREGHRDNPEGTITIRIPCDPTRFFAALSSAYEHCRQLHGLDTDFEE